MQFLAAALVCIGTMILSATSSGADVVPLVLGTATPGGGFAVYGQAVADTLLESDPALKITLQATGGSTQNIPLLEAGKLDLGLVEGTTAYEALEGIGRPPADLRLVAAMYPSPGMFVVRADSRYRTIRDLQGQRVVFGAATSGLVVLARYVLDGLGLDLRKDFDAVLLEHAADGPPRSSAAKPPHCGAPGSAGLASRPLPAGRRERASSVPRRHDIARIQAKYPFLKAMTVAPHSYPGQDRAIVTVGTWSLILARPELSDEAAYRFARALHLAQPALGQRLVQAQATTPENTLAAAPRPGVLHPGAARYLREIGLAP